jgi:membrane-bound serine protease (ClpP class)
MTAEEARKAGVIDVVAVGIDDLLAKIDGRKVTADGTEMTLATAGAKAQTIELDMRTRLLSVISDPNVAFLLLMIGFYGLILEFWHPGSFVPGVIGGISLILALIALSALPVNYGALGLMVLGLGLMIGEVFTPGIGALGIGGLLAFVAGSYFLFEGAGADIEIAVSLPLILGTAFTTAALIFFVIGAAMRSQRRPTMTGAEQVIGAQARVIDWEGETGHVRFNGEVWAARGTRSLPAGAAVRIVKRDGLTLVVEP